jgi:hypothetical protein
VQCAAFSSHVECHRAHLSACLPHTSTLVSFGSLQLPIKRNLKELKKSIKKLQDSWRRTKFGKECGKAAPEFLLPLHVQFGAGLPATFSLYTSRPLVQEEAAEEEERKKGGGQRSREKLPRRTHASRASGDRSIRQKRRPIRQQTTHHIINTHLVARWRS